MARALRLRCKKLKGFNDELSWAILKPQKGWCGQPYLVQGFELGVFE